MNICKKLPKTKSLTSSQPKANPRSSRHRWYFVELAFLIIPWALRNAKDPAGNLVLRSFLIEAESVNSLLNKADRILSICEHVDGTGRRHGKRIVRKQIGISSIQPIYDRLESGAELSEQALGECDYAVIKKQVLSKSGRRRLVKRGRDFSMPCPFDICWGDDFDDL